MNNVLENLIDRVVLDSDKAREVLKLSAQIHSQIRAKQNRINKKELSVLIGPISVLLACEKCRAKLDTKTLVKLSGYKQAVFTTNLVAVRQTLGYEKKVDFKDLSIKYGIGVGMEARMDSYVRNIVGEYRRKKAVAEDCALEAAVFLLLVNGVKKNVVKVQDLAEQIEVGANEINKVKKEVQASFKKLIEEAVEMIKQDLEHNRSGASVTSTEANERKRKLGQIQVQIANKKVKKVGYVESGLEKMVDTHGYKETQQYKSFIEWKAKILC